MKPVGILLTTLAAELLTDNDDRLMADTYLVAGAAGGVNGMTAYLKLARLIGEAAEPTAALQAVERTDGLVVDVSSVCAQLILSCFASVKADYPSRQDATAARARLVGRADASYPLLGGAGAETLDWIVRLVGETVISLSSTAATRVPLVRVETGISLPSTLIAFDLYGSATRAGEIVNRNNLGTPMIMPAAFEALAS